MNYISRHKNIPVIVMLLVMSMHLFMGLRLFCANDVLSVKGVPVLVNPEGVLSVNESWADNDTPNCSCKKHKKCLPSPRALITSASSHRFYEHQRQLSFASFSYFSMADHSQFGDDVEPAHLQVGRENSPPTSTLAQTCILLI